MLSADNPFVCPEPIRNDLQQALERTWSELGQAGTLWNASERIALAHIARTEWRRYCLTITPDNDGEVLMSNKAPGFEKHPDHRLDFQPVKNRVRATFQGVVIADSTAALRLQEGTYPPVLYFPPADLKSEHFRKTSHSTYCPFKGTASYWSLAVPNSDDTPESDGGANAAWGYEQPYDESIAIRDYVAFYPDKVRVEELA